ncbi:MAG: PDZ domain-containing protein [Planctomycetes bacterium]|nr:PDZ domain-containing protein [Planctomycetota bacterium]
MKHTLILLTVFGSFLAYIALSEPASTMAVLVSNQQNNWHAGTWDSGLYSWSTAVHPRTVGVRVKVVDSRTGNTIRNARVELDGRWDQEQMGRQEFGMPAVQEKEFRLTARTDHSGIAVFGLSWQKEVPWSLNRPKDYQSNGSWTYSDSWVRPVDDIEKVQRLVVRHPDYNMSRNDFNFDEWIEFGQNPNSEAQTPEVHENFRLSWENSIGRYGTRFCVLELGESERTSPITDSTNPIFFKKIRDKDFGVVYSELPNLSGFRTPRNAGPYFVILLEVELDPAREEVVIIHTDDNDDADYYDHQEEERARREREARARAVAEKKERERQARAERERREQEARAERERKEREEAEKEARNKKLQSEASRHPLGLAVETLSSSRRKELGLALGVKGVEILYIESGSSADGKLRVRDVVVDIQHKYIGDASDFHYHTDELKSGEEVSISIFRKQSNGDWNRVSRRLRVE